MPPLGNLLLSGHVCLACVVKLGLEIIENNVSFTEKRTLNTVQGTNTVRQKMLKAKGEGGVSLRSPNNRQSSGVKVNEFELTQPSLRRVVSARPGRHQRAQVTKLEFSIFPWQFLRSNE